MSLIHHLQQVADYRTKPHYPLWVVMLLVIMADKFREVLVF